MNNPDKIFVLAFFNCGSKHSKTQGYEYSIYPTSTIGETIKQSILFELG
jgi:hypothetical protein